MIFRSIATLLMMVLTQQLDASAFQDCCNELIAFSDAQKNALSAAISQDRGSARNTWEEELLFEKLASGSAQANDFAFLMLNFGTFDCHLLEEKILSQSNLNLHLEDRASLPEPVKKMKLHSFRVFKGLNLDHVTRLYAPDQKLKNLEGLPDLASIKTVNLSGNQISGRMGFKKLRLASTVNLEGNSIASLEPFTDFPNLKRLNLDYNCVKDLSPLKKTSKYLREVDLNHNMIHYVDLVRAGNGFKPRKLFKKTTPMPAFKPGLVSLKLYSTFLDSQAYCPFKKPTICDFTRPKAHWRYPDNHFSVKPSCLNQLK